MLGLGWAYVRMGLANTGCGHGGSDKKKLRVKMIGNKASEIVATSCAWTEQQVTLHGGRPAYRHE